MSSIYGVIQPLASHLLSSRAVPLTVRLTSLFRTILLFLVYWLDGPRGGEGNFPNTIDLLASGKIEAETIVTHKFPLEEAEEAVKTAHGEDSWKIVLTYE